MTNLIRNALATRRIARLVVMDAILEDIREKIFERWDPADHKLAYLVSCLSCTSVWAGALVVSGLLPKPVLDLLAYSEAAITVGELVDALAERD